VISALDGPYAGQSFALAPGSVTVGRSPDNGIPMPNDVTVSRHHAHIAEENGQHVLYDDGSSNGTFVNNVRVSIQALVPGDIIQFGASKYRYE
jgi:pSer/pThr/pTyr-binding forkhead associated (FHA) protein